MKSLLRRYFYRVLLVSAVLPSVTRVLGQQEGITSWTGGSPAIVGYATNGAGFEFSPGVNMALTALGFGGSDIANYPYQVTLYNASGTALATAQLTTSSTFYNQSYYHSVSPVTLTAGSDYYVGAVQVGDPGGNFWAGYAIETGVNGAFAPNADINYLSYDAGFGPPSNIPTVTGANNGYLIGANFQFTVVPEPSVLCLGLAGVLGLFLTQRRRQ
jgi:hypothetical protein